MQIQASENLVMKSNAKFKFDRLEALEACRMLILTEALGKICTWQEVRSTGRGVSSSYKGSGEEATLPTTISLVIQT